jgi:hypothetical protein
VTTPAGPVLYTALTDLRVNSAYANWHCSAGQNLPLMPGAYSTQLLIDNGSIVLAAPGSSDTCTPPHVLRGQPGLHVGVSN